jgi:hypothetical protein
MDRQCIARRRDDQLASLGGHLTRSSHEPAGKSSGVFTVPHDDLPGDHRGDPACVDGDVTSSSRTAGSIDHGATANHQLMCHVLHLSAV